MAKGRDKGARRHERAVLRVFDREGMPFEVEVTLYLAPDDGAAVIELDTDPEWTKEVRIWTNEEMDTIPAPRREEG